MNRADLALWPLEAQKDKLIWADNPGVQKFLDTISSILADEYIQIAMQNPEVFKNGGLEWK